jgi:hypothetical protein
VRMTVERSLWVTVRALIAGQVPDDQALVARTREEHVWVLKGSSEGRNPSAVAHKGALEDQLFGHLEVVDGGMICDVLIFSKFAQEIQCGRVSELP